MIVITDISSTVPVLESNVQNESDYNVIGTFNRRFAKKRDKSVLYALKTAERIMLRDGIDEIKGDEIGIILSNTFGGWSYVENQLLEMYDEGLEAINPYVATAWFATAAQGEISIKYGIKGYSKTICSGNAGGGIALKHACQSILNGKINYALTGGVEAPDTRLLHKVLDNERLIDGSVMFFLEKEETARASNRSILMEVLDIKVSRLLDVKIKQLAIEKNARFINISLFKEKIVEGIETKTENVLVEEELFAFHIPYYLKLIYEKYKGKTEILLLNFLDKSQTVSILLKVL